MELKHLLSLVTAAMTALGAILYSIGSQHTALAVALWLAAILSLVVTDFLRVIRLPRNVGLVLMWAALAVFLPQFLLQATANGRAHLGQSPDWQLQTVANILICLQCTLLFQEKDARTFGWLALMSLLQVVVAARYSRGVVFGGLLIVYGVVGMLGLSLLSLYAQRGRSDRDASRPAGPEQPAARWPLTRIEPGFIGTASSSGRAGVVPELFGRLMLIIAGAVVLSAVIFYTVPRPWIRSWRMGEANREVSVVGFNDQITLGSLGETIESREEVMRVRLLDSVSHEIYPLRDEIYLKGTTVTWYSQNHWRAQPPRHNPASVQDSRSELDIVDWEDEIDPVVQIGSTVIQQTTLEPFLDRDDLFYIWPLVGPINEQRQGIHLEPRTERLQRLPTWSGEPHPRPFTFEVRTSGLVDGHQADLIPSRRKVDVSLPSRFLQMPDDRSSLPHLRALAESWRHDASISGDKHYEIARLFERQLSSSGQFHYSLQGQDRDESIDAIEDFVTNHPRGHCEYFATALALMLRSQGIPSRVVLGYRCDEWDPKAESFQVRQLHAHAWVEAFLAPEQIPQSLQRNNPLRWRYGGWLRLDGTPAADVGSVAANRTTLGAWQSRLHNLQRYWESYIADMDREKQQVSVYKPVQDALHNFMRGLVSPAAWREVFARWWAALARTFKSGIMGKLIGAVLVLAVGALLGLAAWWLTRTGRWLWRWFDGRSGARAARARSSVEFYHRFEQLAQRIGLLRTAGQTPREFARAAGIRLATVSGRPELFDRAMHVAEAFYLVRFGKQEMDAVSAQAVQQALEELKAGAETPQNKTIGAPVA